MQVTFEGDGLSVCQTCHEITSVIYSDWAESALKILLYSFPIVSFVTRVFDLTDRFCSSHTSLINDATKLWTEPKSDLQDRVRHITRVRQTSDVLFVIGSLVMLVLFSNIVLSSASVTLTLLAPTIVSSLLMILHAQVQYKDALEELNKEAWRYYG